MLDPAILKNIAHLRFRNRWVPDGTAGGYFRLKDGTAVRLSAAEWKNVSVQHSNAIRASSRRLFWTLALAIPAAVSILFVNALLLSAFTPDGRGPTWLGASLFFGTMIGLPLYGMIRSVRANQRALQAVDSSLRKRPRAAIPDLPDPRATNILEALMLISVFTVVVQIYGTLNPDAYRNTPWTGTKLGPTGYAGIAIIMLVVAVHVRRRLRRKGGAA